MQGMLATSRSSLPRTSGFAPRVCHARGCKYNVEKTIARFVAYSRAVKSIDKNATPILERIASKQAAEVRLHILMEALHKAKEQAHASSGRVNPYRAVLAPTGTEYIRTEKVLKSYFRNAQGILALAARLQSNPDIEFWVTLKYGDQVIPWDNFFFDLEDYQQLYQYLNAAKHKLKTAMYPRPVALVVKVFKEAALLQVNGEVRIISTNQVITTRDKEKLAIRPVLYFSDGELAIQKSKEAFLLVCGIPRMGALKAPTKPGLKPRFDVSISVVDARQICQYSPT